MHLHYVLRSRRFSICFSCVFVSLLCSGRRTLAPTSKQTDDVGPPEGAGSRWNIVRDHIREKKPSNAPCGSPSIREGVCREIIKPDTGEYGVRSSLEDLYAFCYAEQYYCGVRRMAYTYLPDLDVNATIETLSNAGLQVSERGAAHLLAFLLNVSHGPSELRSVNFVLDGAYLDPFNDFALHETFDDEVLPFVTNEELVTAYALLQDEQARRAHNIDNKIRFWWLHRGSFKKKITSDSMIAMVPIDTFVDIMWSLIHRNIEVEKVVDAIASSIGAKQRSSHRK